MHKRAAACTFVLALGCGGGGGGADAGLSGDAAADAAPVACEADHAESGEARNDLLSAGGVPEESGQVLSAGGGPFTLCGQLDPAQATDQVGDIDFYVFDVVGDEPVEARVELRGPAALADFEVFVDLWTASGQYVGGGAFLEDHALFAGVQLPPGIYLVSVMAVQEPAMPELYEVTFLEDPNSCAPADGEPDYQEQDEGPTHRLNDLVSISYSPEVSVSETPGDDSPEETGITLTAGQTYHLRGLSAEVAPGDDEYLDRDTFLLATGPETDEVELRLAWPHEESDVDMDLYLFAEGDPTDDLSRGHGTFVGTADDELITVTLRPGSSYWLWVATYDDAPEALPALYDLTLCPRTFPVQTSSTSRPGRLKR